MKQLKKITSKDMLGDNIKPGDKYIVGGVAYGYFEKSTTYGESIAIEGDFVAVNPATGEQVTAPIAYFPSDTAESIRRRLDNREDQAEVVEVKLQVEAVESDKSKTGYSWLTSQLNTKESLDRRATMAAVLTSAATLLIESKK